MVALGGNAFQSKEDKGTVEDYWRNAYTAARVVAELIKRGYRVIVTHGNGPQVGVLVEWMYALSERIPPMTLDIAGAMTQGWLGYILQQAIRNVLMEKNLLGSAVRGVVTIVNQVLVDVNDPAFRSPTKFIGPWYSEEDARRIARERGWVMKPDPRGGWRRVVPSPTPIENIECEVIKTLIDSGFVVIASGGGGIPVVNDRGKLRGVEAVIDKDLAAERLASSLRASILMILTDVDGVYINFGKPNARKLTLVKVEEIERYYREGHFPPGSMGPKILAAIKFLKSGGEKVVIAHLNHGVEALEGREGTTIIP